MELSLTGIKMSIDLGRAASLAIVVTGICLILPGMLTAVIFRS
jgi:hypothetical protein